MLNKHLLKIIGEYNLISEEEVKNNRRILNDRIIRKYKEEWVFKYKGYCEYCNRRHKFKLYNKYYFYDGYHEKGWNYQCSKRVEDIKLSLFVREIRNMYIEIFVYVAMIFCMIYCFGLLHVLYK